MGDEWHGCGVEGFLVVSMSRGALLRCTLYAVRCTLYTVYSGRSNAGGHLILNALGRPSTMLIAP
jgi:hypothetical protein